MKQPKRETEALRGAKGAGILESSSWKRRAGGPWKDIYCCLCKIWSTDRKSSLEWLNRLMKSSLSKKNYLVDSSLRRQGSLLRSSDRWKLMRVQLSQWHFKKGSGGVQSLSAADSALRHTRGLHRTAFSSLSTLGGWRTVVSLPPTTTKEAGGDARGDGEAKKLSGGRKS